MGIEEYIPIHSQDEINPITPEDYKGEDGLMRCGVCGGRKESRVKYMEREMIVPCICDCVKKKLAEEKEAEERREEMRRIERLKNSSMMAGKFRDATFDVYTIRPENKAAYDVSTSYCESWRKMYEDNQGLLFYGPVGTGKSFTAACIANNLLAQGIPVIMTSFVKILQEIRTTEDESRYIAILNTARLLIIDDLGAERGTDYALEKVYNVIDSRSREAKPMILTTNLELGEMMDCTDLRYRRVYDRIFETCFPVEMAGDSFRRMEAKRRFDDMKKLITG